MRLTEKEQLTSSDLYKMEINCELEQVAQWHNKLSKLEDIEEELGIDLIKLIECIRSGNGIWKKDFNGGLINTRCMLACYFNNWQIYDKENIYELKDYGKTWALTREELL